MKRKLIAVIVDDNKEFRSALRLVLELIEELDVVDEFDSGATFINNLNAINPELVFMDVDMPLMNGIEATRQAKIIYPELNVIALSFHGQQEYMIQMNKAGANHFIIKNDLDLLKIQSIVQNIT